MPYKNYYKKPATPETETNENGEAKNEVATTSTMSIEALLCSNQVKSLAESLKLAPTQIAKANKEVMRLQCDSKLSNATAMSKVRFAYSVALDNYKSPNAIAPVVYGKGIQAQPQYQAYLEDMQECGGVDEVNWIRMYKGQKYPTFINKNDNKEIKEIPIIELDNPFEKLETIGYYCYAKCKNGKTYTSLMSIEECLAWAERYSISYKAFKGGTAKSAIWNDNFDDMAIKTCIKNVARKVLKDYPYDRLAKLIEIDQAVFDDNGISYADNPQNQPKENSTTINNRLTPKEDKPIEEVDVKPVEEDKKD